MRRECGRTDRLSSGAVDEHVWTEGQQTAFRGSRDRAEKHLREARSLLDVDDAALGLFHEFIDHHEQGLALDELAHAADEFDVPTTFWVLLQMAAREMQLTAADETHGSAVQIVERHIS
jgi:hypothetical protein